jgi:hypothetical protein
VSAAAFRADALILACAISAGIHAALAPEHFTEEGFAAGLGFVASAVILAALAVVRTVRPTEVARTAAALTFAGLIAAYTLAVTTGVPGLHPDRESIDGLALFTKAVEAAGLALSLSPLRPLAALTLEPKGTS